MKYRFILFFTAVTFSVNAFADLSPEIKAKLDSQVESYFMQCSNEPQSDPQFHAFVNLLRSKAYQMQLNRADMLLWSKVLIHFSEVKDLDIPLSDLTPDLEETSEEREAREKKYRDAETLRKDLASYLKSKFMTRKRKAPSSSFEESKSQEGSTYAACSRENPAVLNSQIKQMFTELKERVLLREKPPRIHAGLLFQEFLVGEEHQGWKVHLEKLRTFRGTAGYEFIGMPQSAGEDSKSQMMVALTNPVLAQTPLYQVNEKPVALSSSAESQKFFRDLPNELKRQSDGSWLGYRYILFPDSLINTDRYRDSASREPISIYLMKKVKPETGKKYVLKKQRFAELEENVSEMANNHDLFHEAQALRVNEKRDSSVRDRKKVRARQLMKILADKGIVRAQHELAIMYQKGEGGAVDLEKAKHYKKLALENFNASSMPSLDFEPNPRVVQAPAQPAPQARREAEAPAAVPLVPYVAAAEGDPRYTADGRDGAHPVFQGVTNASLIAALKSHAGSNGSGIRRAPDDTFILGETVKDAQGEVLRLPWQQAKETCEAKGAVLPSIDHYKKIRTWLGGDPNTPDDHQVSEGYRYWRQRQVMPEFNNLFWSSSPFEVEGYSDFSYVFGGDEGSAGGYHRLMISTFRCVVVRP